MSSIVFREMGDRVALFDMDGTLLPWDTQLLFSNYVIRRHRWRTLLMVVFVVALPLALLRVLNEEQMKRLYLVYLWRMRLDEVKELAHEFAERVVDTMIYPELRSCLESHRRQGDLTVMVTASPDIYATEIAQRLGFHKVIATEVELEEERFPFYPVLPKGNNKGSRKVKELQNCGILPATHVTAYSDSKADLPMLTEADEVVLVNPSEKLQARFRSHQPKVYTPELPWRSRSQKICAFALLFLGIKSSCL